LALALLPDHIPPFKDTRQLMLGKRRLFLEQGNAALPAIQQLNNRLAELKTEIAASFPLTETEVKDLRENLRAHILKIHDLELEAVKLLQAAMS
jgi:hypothetical protein